MTDERSPERMTDEEAQDIIERRQRRHRWGIVLLVLGVFGFLATTTAMLVREAGVDGGLGILGICFAMLLVAAGYVDGSKITPGWWK